MALIPILIMVAIASNFLGFIIAFFKRKSNKRMAVVGIIVNGLALCCYIGYTIALFYIIANVNMRL